MVMQRDAVQLLHVLQAEFAGDPLSMHKIELHLRIPCEEYEQLSLRVDASNRQKRHHERIRRIAVDYAFSPTGSIEVHIACSNQPFRIATYDDLIMLYSTLGQARDRLVFLLSDTSESIVPPLASWILKRCDINKDLPHEEHGINYLRVNMQLKHAGEAFRVYTKSLGDKLVLRAEKEQTPGIPLHVYISNMLDGGTHNAEMQESVLAAYARQLSRKQRLDSAPMADST